MKKNYSSIIVGGGFILLGLFLLGELIGISGLHNFFDRFWPFILILAGLAMIGMRGPATIIGYGFTWLGFLMILRWAGVFDDNGRIALVLLLVISGLFIIAITTRPALPKQSRSTHDNQSDN